MDITINRQILWFWFWVQISNRFCLFQLSSCIRTWLVKQNRGSNRTGVLTGSTLSRTQLLQTFYSSDSTWMNLETFLLGRFYKKLQSFLRSWTKTSFPHLSRLSSTESSEDPFGNVDQLQSRWSSAGSASRRWSVLWKQTGRWRTLRVGHLCFGYKGKWIFRCDQPGWNLEQEVFTEQQEVINCSFQHLQPESHK